MEVDMVVEAREEMAINTGVATISNTKKRANTNLETGKVVTAAIEASEEESLIPEVVHLQVLTSKRALLAAKTLLEEARETRTTNIRKKKISPVVDQRPQSRRSQMQKWKRS
jgi:hypothetical protein